MRFGFTLPNNWGVEAPEGVVDLAVTAEELGFDSVWVNHHVLNVGYVAERLGDRPYYDAFMVLAWAAARTSTIRLGTSVLVVPYLHPIPLAKTLATLDQLSRGRLEVGVGVGSLEQEHEALGNVPYAERGAYTDEALAVLRELWEAEEPRFEGRYFRFPPVLASPKPAQRPRPPLVIGGNRRPALRRVARLGDGWHPMALRPEGVASRLVTLDEELAAVGRKRSELSIQVRLDLAMRDEPGRAPLHGPPDHLRRAVDAYAQVGVGELIVSLSTGDVERIRAALERFAAEVMVPSRA
ncbi:MAG: TIGR03619 family F420-dependent LLM class oxidoreductase [Acidimicrobiia bacterium]|nr:TIGR03619 family F420-dependent LLM class oxidoreductase [Acidimicrobiia bacterium]